MRLFAHRLALKMQRLDVDAMLAEMTAPQLAQWLDYYQVEPWGEDRADLRNAQLMALLFNLFRRRGTAPKRASDFMLRFGRRARQTPRQMFEVLKMAAAFSGFRVEKGKGDR